LSGQLRATNDLLESLSVCGASIRGLSLDTGRSSWRDLDVAKLFRVIDEHTWLSCTVPRHLLRYMKDRTTDRKLRLWACAATAHRYAQDESVLAVVALVEAWADGDSPAGLKEHDRDRLCSPSAWEAAYEGTLRPLEKLPSSEKKNRLTEFQLAAVHEVFGNPFHSVVIDPRWIIPTVLSIAQAAYVERLLPTGHLDADRLAVLADALEEAGCSDPAMLAHLRGPGPHLRGCWPLDLLLRKV
jgi:hypothetical protein